MKKLILHFWIFLLFLLFSAVISFAQTRMSTNSGALNETQLVEDVFLSGNCFEVDENSITFFGAAGTIGTFSDGEPWIGIDEGIVLTTGQVATAGINNSPGVVGDGNNLRVGDDDLTIVAGDNSFDATVLEFDFIPTANTVSFKYVFGSEEYPEFVCSQFNDVFAFFISGPGFNGPYSNNAENIAIIPGTNLPVAIGTVNPGTPGGTNDPNDCTSLAHADKYNDNNTLLVPVGSSPQADGFTNVFTAIASVQRCQTYHIKIAIADVVDQSYDSFVFLEANSFNAGPKTIANISGSFITGTDVYEGCIPGTITFERQDPTDTSVPINVDFTIGGTATAGTDYTSFGNQVTIPVGEESTSVSIDAILDNVAEGTETIEITLVNDACDCSALPPPLVINVLDYLEPEVEAGQDISICNGESTDLMATTTNGLADFTYTWDNGGGTGNPVTVSPTETTTYEVEVTDVCGNTAVDQVTVTVLNGAPDATINDPGTLCPDTAPIMLTAANGGGTWSGPGITDATSGEFDPALALTMGSSPFTIEYEISITCGTSTDDISITVEAPSPTITGDDAFCTDNTITLDAGANFTSYAWSPNGENTQTIDVSSGGTYSVTVADANGCTGSDSFDVTENTNPTPTISGSASFCTGSSTTLDAGVFDSYLWSPNNETTQTITANVADTYSVIVTDENGCTGENSVDVTEEAELQPNITGDNQICAGESTTLDAGSFASYLWSNGETTQTITVDAPDTYEVQVTDASGCTGTGQIIVTQSPPLTPVISGSLSFCTGSNTTLDAGNFDSYLWSTGETTQTITVDAIGNYAVVVSDENGCTGETSVNVTEEAELQPNITGDNQICASETTTLDAGSFASYLWSNGETTQTITVAAPDTYEVQVTDASGCTGTGQIIVTQSPPLTPVISGSLSFCTGSNTTLDAGNFDSYLWSTGETTQTITVDAIGNYAVEVSDENGCTGETSVNVTEEAELQPNITGANQICAGESTTLDAGSFTSYLWSNGETTQTITVAAPDTYEVQVTDASGCTGTGQIIVTQSPPLTPVISGSLSFCTGSNTTLDAGNFDSYLWSTGETTQTITVDAIGNYAVEVSDENGCTGETSVNVTEEAELQPNITGDNQICASETTTLDAGSFASYLWSNGETTQTITVDAPDTYEVQVTDASGCTGTGQIIVTQSPPLTPTISGSTSFCTGSSTTLAAGNFSSYLWSPNNETTASIEVNVAGEYSVIVTDDSGCTGETSIIVTEEAELQPNITGDTEVCAGETTTLDAGSFASYLWSNGETTQTITVAAPDTYEVQVTDASGCTGTGQIIVTQSPPLTPTISGSTSFCTGSNTTLDAGSFDSYLWSTGETTQTIVVDVIGNYAVEVSDENGCTGETSVNVTEEAELQPNITGDTEICDGETTTLDAGSFASYLWSNGETTQTITVAAPDTYEVQVTDASGCTGTGEVTVTQSPPLTPTISGSTSFCTGSSTTLDAGNFSSYLWSPNNETTATIEVNVAGEYSVIVTDDSGCTGETSIIVTEEAELQPNITGDTEICDGETTTLNAGEFASYEWLPNGETTQTIDVSTPGLYEVLVTDASGCTGTGEVTVTQNPPLTPTITGSITFCLGSSTTLDAGEFDNYIWSPNGATTSSITVSTAGEYSVIVSDADGCTGETSIVVTQEEELQPVIGGELAFCEGESTELDAGLGFDSYSWSPNGEITQNITVNVAGTYEVLVTDASGCTGMAEVTVVQNINPIPIITGELTYCLGESTTLNAGSFSNYSWEPNGETTQTIDVNAPGNYTVIVTDENGCTGQASVEVIENVAIQPTIVGETQICEGDATTLDAGEYNSYLWQPNGEITQTISATEAQTYTVIVTDGNGCTAEASIDVSLFPNPVPTITGNTNVCPNESTTLDAGNFAAYEWLPNGEQTQTIIAQAPGNYSVIVTDENGCTGEAAIEVIENAVTDPTITGELGFCTGTNTTLTASTGYTNYTWSNNESGESITVDIPGPYTVVVTDANGCTSEASVVVEEYPLPNIQISGSTSFCSGSTTTLDAGAGFAVYIWLKDGIPTATGQTLIVSAPGNYSVEVQDNNGCINTASVTVIESTSLNPVITGNLSICDGETTTLDAGLGFETYSWQPNGEITQTIETNQSGTYSVEVSDASGCTGTFSVEVIANTTPIINITGSPVFCAGTSTTLGVDGNFENYNWSTFENTPTIIVDAPGDYSVEVTDENGCVGRADIIVSEEDGLSPTIDGIPSVCDGGSTTLTVGETYDSYEWQPNGEITQSITVSVTGVYTVLVTDESGCTGTESIQVNPFVNPTPTISGNLEICSGTSTTLSVNETYVSYEWSPNGETTQSITADLADIYSVIVTDENGCIGTTNVIVTETSALNPSIGGVFEFCEGTSTTIRVNETFDNYSWSQNGEVTQEITVTTPGPYTVVVSDAAGCTGEATVTVVQNPNPTPSIAGSSSYCVGSSTTLDAGAGFAAYEWQPNGETTPTITVASPDTYSVIVTDENGCIGTDEVIVTEETELQPSIIGNLSICDGEPTTLDAGAGFDSYEWDPNGENTQSITTSVAGNYTVLVTDASGCTGQTTVTVEQNPNPTVTIDGILTFCIGGNTILTATPGFVSYEWSNAATTDVITITTPSIYSVIVTDENGCTAENSVEVQELSELQPTIAGILSICNNDGSTELTVNGNYESYNWQPNGETTQTITATEIGDYTVLVTDASGCTGTETVTITPFADPPPVIVGDFNICAGESTTLSVESNYDAYEWSTGESLQSIVVDQPGTYSVIVTDENGCTGETGQIVMANASPSITIATTNSNCGATNGVATATVTGGLAPYTYSWDNGETTAEITNLSSGTYEIIVTDDNGCTSREVANTSDEGAPTTSIVATETTCGLNEGTATVTPDGGIEPYTYLWNDANNQTTATATDLVAGDYEVIVSDANNCSTTASVTVIGNTEATTISCGELTNESVAFTWTAVSGAIGYQIVINGTIDTVGANTLSFVVATEPLETVDISIITLGEAACGNSIAATQTCTSLEGECQPSEATLTGLDTSYCFEDEPTTVAATPAGGTFSINGTTITGNVFDPSSVGSGEHIISYTFTDVDGCLFTASDTVIVSQVNVNTIGSTTLELGDSLSLEAIISGFSDKIEVLWTDLIGTTPTVNPTEDISYTVIATDEYGCTANALVNVDVFSITDKEFIATTGFSPNGDGINDLFKVYATNVANANLRIFNRWGQEIQQVESENINDLNWNGTQDDEDVEIGTYVYYIVITFTDGTERIYQGNVILFR